MGSAEELTKLWPRTQCRYYVLVFVMRKLDRELLGSPRIAKPQARIITRGTLCMAIRADDGLSALEELRAMTTDAGVVIRKVGDVWKIPSLPPIRRRHLFVASVAALLVLFG